LHSNVDDEFAITQDDELKIKLLTVCSAVDADGDGRVDAEEIAQAIQEVYGEEEQDAGRLMTRAAELLLTMDRDSDGSVTCVERTV